MVSLLKPPGSDDVPTRGARKQLTRERLLDSALTLMSRGHSFPSLGLRELTREAGVVPTAFYRHFKDMDELGLALVEQCGLTLRRLLRDARKLGLPQGDIIRSSVRIYLEYVKANPRHFRTATSERSGGSPAMRRAIRNEISLFVREMAQDVRALGFRPDLPTATLELICGLVVNTMLSAASEILDLNPSQPQLERELEADLISQLRLVFIGAEHWQP